jgi:hypothetical protein
MEGRGYTLDFYRVDCRTDKGKPLDFGEQLGKLLNSTHSSARDLSGVTYELRDLHQQGHYIAGVVARFRTRDLPHAAQPKGRERELDLTDEEGLIEKCHLLYVPSDQVLVHQRNRMAAGPGTTGRYFTSLLGHTTVFHPILQPEPMKRLLHHGSQIREVDIAVARPSGSILDRPSGGPSWDRHILATMRETGAYKLRTVIKSNGRTAGKARFLQQDVLDPIARLFGSLTVQRARVKYEPDEDDPGFVDLLKDRVSAQVTVESNGRYPNSISMWRAAAKAWAAERSDIRQVVGKGHADDD